MDARTKLAKLREWNALADALDGRPRDYCERRCADAARELREAGVTTRDYDDTTDSGRANLAALEAEVAGLDRKLEPSVTASEATANAAAVHEDLQRRLNEAEAKIREQDVTLARIEHWTHTYAATLMPPPLVADTYGNGMRNAKAAVSALLAARQEVKP